MKDDMAEYVASCLSEGYSSPEACKAVLAFYERFRERYPSIAMDAAPSSDGGKEAFLLALDNGIECFHFEWIEGDTWDIFYKQRETNTLMGVEDLKNVEFDEFDEYIRKFES